MPRPAAPPVERAGGFEAGRAVPVLIVLVVYVPTLKVMAVAVSVPVVECAVCENMLSSLKETIDVERPVPLW
jgi:hypothetical protein